MLKETASTRRAPSPTTLVGVRLHGTEDWEAWGDKWARHVDCIGNLEWVRPSDWGGPGPGLTAPSPRRLDWGAVVYEVSKAEVEQLAWEPEWLADTDSARKQRQLLEWLSDDERYGVVFVELY